MSRLFYRRGLRIRAAHVLHHGLHLYEQHGEAVLHIAHASFHLIPA